MTDIAKLTKMLIEFRDARDWKQFHNTKDLAIAISIETSELLEVFLWKHYSQASKDKIKEELADVIIYSLLLAYECGFDINEIVNEKIKSNNLKYPIDKVKGYANKYNEI
jgi:NTP pyrophosphatase (non-canonical NTP hydrolase)